MQVTFHFDPVCPWTWLSSRFLLAAASVPEADLEVAWAPLSLAHLNEGKEVPEQYRAPMAAGRGALRVVQHLVAIDDQAAIGRFYEALGDRFHRGGQAPSASLVLEAAQAAGLDDAAVAAVDDESLDEAVAVSTDRAVAAAGPDIGSPVLHWTGDQGQDVWIFGPLFDLVPSPERAAELWQVLRTAATEPSFLELKRGRHNAPALADS